jgi:hypothetical protein
MCCSVIQLKKNSSISYASLSASTNSSSVDTPLPFLLQSNSSLVSSGIALSVIQKRHFSSQRPMGFPLELETFISHPALPPL